MIEIRYSKNFLKSLKKSPKNTQEKLAHILSILQENPYTPKLHTKQLTGKLTGPLSFRITRDWRVIFQFLNPHTIQLLRATHRKEIYR